jgi:sulfite reductase beta subunit-like hemoprotein
MPRKRPVTTATIPHLRKVMKEGFSSLITVRSIFAGHFKQDDKVKRRIERLVEDYQEFEREVERELGKKTNAK